jgi:hypothetical protein
MAGLRYQDLSPFVSGRNQRINGTTYAVGDPIDIIDVLSCRHLDALISQHRIVPAVASPYGDRPASKHPQPVHVPSVEWSWLLFNGADRLGAAPPPEGRSLPSKSQTGTGAFEEDGKDKVPFGTIADVLAWVNDDVDRAQDAWDVEMSKSNPRSTLIQALEQIIE